jgi:hypothetical protein
MRPSSRFRSILTKCPVLSSKRDIFEFLGRWSVVGG